MTENNSFIANVNLIAENMINLNPIKQKLQELININNNLDSITKISGNTNDIVIIKNNISGLNLISSSINELLLISNNMANLNTVNAKYAEVEKKYSETKNIANTFRVELDKFFSRDADVKEIYDDILKKNIQINANLLSIHNKDIEVSNIAAIAIAAKNAIEDKYLVYEEIMTHKSQLLLIAAKLNQFVSVEENIDAKYQDYLQVLGIKSQIIEIAPKIDSLISASEDTNSNMEVSLSLLNSARENIELLKNYQTYEDRNILRFNAIETKELLNYTKTLARFKILEELI